jgi:hypothetical protein
MNDETDRIPTNLRALLILEALARSTGSAQRWRARGS